jgi:hypothetical protein
MKSCRSRKLSRGKHVCIIGLKKREALSRPCCSTLLELMFSLSMQSVPRHPLRVEVEKQNPNDEEMARAVIKT